MATSRLWAQQEQEEMKNILHAYWDNIVNSNSKDRDTKIKKFQDYAINTLYKIDSGRQKQIEDLFEKTINRDNEIKFEDFYTITKTFGYEIISMLNNVEKLLPPEERNYVPRPHHLQQNEIILIESYMQDRNMSASVSLRSNNSDSLTTIILPEQTNVHAFAMHSVGKVFTGMLTLMMVDKGIIPEADLTKPLSETETFKNFIESLNPPLPLPLKNMNPGNSIKHWKQD